MRIRKVTTSRRLACAALSAAAVAVAGCGGGGDDKGPDIGAATITPSNASVYFDALVRPQGEQKAGVEGFLGAILDTSDPGAKITSLIDEQLKKDGDSQTFSGDIEPWLGDRIGVFETGFADNAPTLTMVQATDTDRGLKSAEASAKTLAPAPDYKGVSSKLDENGDALGIIDDFVVSGDPAAFKAAVDASKGDSLAESEQFKKATADVPGEAIGTTYVDLKTAVGNFAATQQDLPKSAVEDGLAKLGIGDSFVASVTAADKAVSVNLAGLGTLGGSGSDTPSKLLAGLPSDAWLAVGVDNVGVKVNSLLHDLGSLGIPGLTEDTVALLVQQRAGLDLKDDVTSWLGGAALFLRGSDPANLDGALVLESTDDAAAARTMNALRTAVAAQRQAIPQPLKLGSGGNGFTITDPSISQPINFVQQNGKVVIGVGDAATQAALTPSDTLAQAPSFSAASSSIGGGGPQFYVSVPEAIGVLAKDPSTAADPGFAKAEPYLLRLAYLTAGGAGDGLKLVVGSK